MKKILISVLLIMTIIFAGCSNSNNNESNEVEIESDGETQIQEITVEESIQEDLSEEVTDIEIGELI
jgi:protein involved in sex pheromone biosynthesis